MDDALAVRIFERVGDLRAIGHDIADREGRLRELVLEATTAEIRHDELQGALVLAKIVERHDMGMIQRCGELRLPMETLAKSRTLGETLVENLDGDTAAHPSRAR